MAAIPHVALRRSVFRRALLLLLAVGGPVAGFATVLYWRDASTERRLHEHEALSLVDLAADTIVRHTAAVRSDLLLLVNEPLLADLLAGRTVDRARLDRRLVTFCRLKRVYDRIRVIDRDGREVAGVDYLRGRPLAVAPADLQIETDRRFLDLAMSLGEEKVQVSSLDLARQHGSVVRPLKPVIRFAAAVFDDTGRRSGVVILNYLGSRLLDTLDDVAAGFPGVLLLLSDDGSYLRGRPPEELWAFALNHDYRFPADHPQAWQEVRDLYRGQFLLPDGLFTFRSVPLGGEADDGMTIVARVPRDELMRGTDRWRGRALVAAIFGLPALALASWYLSYSVHVRREHERRLAESERRLRRLSRELLDAQERERAALSRDLHDDLGQLVTLIALDVERAKTSGGARRSQSIDRAIEGTRRVLDRLHEIAFRVRPRLLDELGLREAVQSFLTEFEESTGIEVTARLRLAEADLPGVVAENAFRILQEALTNVSKHARASEVQVEMQATASALELRIVDHGVGFDAEHPDEGLGLLGMRERVELLGGSLTVRARPGSGTAIEAHLPVRNAEERNDDP